MEGGEGGIEGGEGGDGRRGGERRGRREGWKGWKGGGVKVVVYDLCRLTSSYTFVLNRSTIIRKHI